MLDLLSCFFITPTNNIDDSTTAVDRGTRSDTEDYHGIKIINSYQISGFEYKVNQSLALLHQYAPTYFAEIQQHTQEIFSFSRTRAHVTEKKISISEKYLNSVSIEYLAGTLVHENLHIKIWWTRGFSENSVAEELECIAGQIESLKQVGASRSEIRELEQQDGTHFTKGDAYLDY